MDETTLYFIRHGETEYNRRRILQGRCIDSSLNGTGRRQAEALAERFADVSLDVIYTSALARSIETAEVVAANHPGVRSIPLAGLDEMSWGIYEGETRPERIKEVVGNLYAHWERGQFEYRVEEGESVYEVRDRSVAAVGEILDAHGGKTVLVVSHGRLLRVLLATLLDAGLEKMDEFDHANTCVNIVTHRSGRFEASLLNCTAHLQNVDSGGYRLRVEG